MQRIISFLEKELGEKINEIAVEDIRVGLFYTGVKLSTGDGGVAYTPIEELDECCSIEDAGEISGKTVLQIIEDEYYQNIIGQAIVTATLNALSQIVFKNNPEKYKYSKIDVTDLILKNDNVVIIGYFKPLIPKIMRKTCKIKVLEKKKIVESEVEIYPEKKADEIIPEADVLIISGSTIVNQTINKILNIQNNAREKILLGPTASMIPQPWFELGITAVMGVKITDTDEMLKIISEGGGARQLLSKCAEKTAFLKKN